jgi:hypothetical protein
MKVVRHHAILSRGMYARLPPKMTSSWPTLRPHVTYDFRHDPLNGRRTTRWESNCKRSEVLMLARRGPRPCLTRGAGDPAQQCQGSGEKANSTCPRVRQAHRHLEFT